MSIALFFFCVLCFVLHARACLTLELPRSLAVCYLMLSSGPELVLSSVYKNVYKPTHFPRNSMDSISNIRTGSEAHTMCTRVSREKEKKELYHVCPWITYILHRLSCRKREDEKMGEERREKEKI